MRTITIEAVTILLILLFGYAAVSKLLVYEKFVIQIAQSEILKGVAAYIALCIPVIELFICGLLVWPPARLTGLYAATILMMVFSGYVFAILFLGSTVPCSCGGILNQLDWKTHLVFNLLFTGMAGVALLLEKKRLTA